MALKKYAADNLMFLRKEYPNIYEHIRNRSYDGNRIEITQSRNGQPNLCVADEDGNRIMLYSRYNPEQEVARWIDLLDENMRKAKHVLFYGFGLGYHVEAFMAAFPNKKVYVMEPDTDLFLAALECRDLRPVLENQRLAVFAVGTDLLVEANFLELIYRVIKDSFAYAVVPAIYRKLYEKDLSRFVEQMGIVALRTRANIHTAFRFQEEWSENFVRNIAHNLRSYPFGKMKDACRGIPALVVGSGPSLNMDLDMVRKLKGRALIISAGSSVQALLRHGIEPDLMVSVDPHENNHKVFSGLDIREIPFLYTSTIRHTILDQDLPYLTHIPLTTDSISLYLMDVDKDEPQFFSTSTVSGTAIQAAVFLGCSEVVLVGQDFSYPNDEYYASGVLHAPSERLKKMVDEADEFVENVNGGQNRTSKSMLVLKQSVELVMDTFEYSEFYNASQIGAKIAHTKPKTLQQLHEERKEAPDLGDRWFRERMLSRLEKCPPERVRQVEKRVLESFRELKKLTEQLDEIRACLDKADDLAPDKPGLLEAWLREFSECWSKMLESEAFRVFYRFLLQAEINVVERYFLDMKEEKDPRVKIKQIRPVMTMFLSGADRVNPTLLKSMEDLINDMGWEADERDG